MGEIARVEKLVGLGRVERLEENSRRVPLAASPAGTALEQLRPRQAEQEDWRVATAFYAGGFQYVAGGGNHGWEDFDDEIAAVLRFCLRADGA